MPVTPEQVLNDLIEATATAKAATSEARTAAKELRNIVKDQQRLILDAIFSDVAKAVAEIRAEAAEDMRTEAAKVIAAMAADWRRRIGLDP